MSTAAPAAIPTNGALDPASSAPAASAEVQVVALHLGNEMYGLDIAHVHTVIVPQTITHVPKAPDFVRGVINLRGRILPVIDLRARFGLPPLAENKQAQARTVIMNAGGLSAGLIVDAVSEVLRLPAGCIDPPSHLVSSVDAECITGIGRIKGGDNGEGAAKTERLIILLDVYRALASGGARDASVLQALAREAGAEAALAA